MITAELDARLRECYEFFGYYTAPTIDWTTEMRARLPRLIELLGLSTELGQAVAAHLDEIQQEDLRKMEEYYRNNRNP
jgi:hypothetical protein